MSTNEAQSARAKGRRQMKPRYGLKTGRKDGRPSKASGRKADKRAGESPANKQP